MYNRGCSHYWRTDNKKCSRTPPSRCDCRRCDMCYSTRKKSYSFARARGAKVKAVILYGRFKRWYRVIQYHLILRN